MELQLNSEFSLTNKKLSMDFKLIYNFSFVTIEKIILKSHLEKPPTSWSNIIGNTYLIITQTFNTNATSSKRISLLTFLTALHKFPLLDTHIEIPSKTDRDFSSMSDFTTNIEYSIEINGIKDPVDFLFLYKTTPGVSIDEKIEL
jgi:hypothetical protein